MPMAKPTLDPRRPKRFIKGLSPPLPATSPADVDNSLYEEDFVAWIDRQAALLRAGRFDSLDCANLAEELEDMGKARRQELRSRLEVLLTHLLKYQFQPEMRSGSWRGTIGEQRRRIEDAVEESPSLQATLDALAEDAKLYRRAVQQAVLETGLPDRVFPKTNPYGVTALDPQFWPGSGPHPDLR